MKRILSFFSGKKRSFLADCIAFKVDDEQSDLLYGGFKEYKPPIYEQKKEVNNSIKTIELVSDINQS